MPGHSISFLFFFFNDTATTEIYTLSLHDALPIYAAFDTDSYHQFAEGYHLRRDGMMWFWDQYMANQRSEEHTSELQSHSDLVCRLLLEKKNKNGFSVGNELSHRL